MSSCGCREITLVEFVLFFLGKVNKVGLGRQRVAQRTSTPVKKTGEGRRASAKSTGI